MRMYTFDCKRILGKAKKLCALALALVLLPVLAGCDGWLSGIQERTVVPDAHATMPSVPPKGGDVAANKVPVTLYYRYKTEPYLAPYSVLLDVTNDKSIEQAVLERLIQGPDSDRYAYTALIDAETSVSVEEKRGHLEITLSQEYVDFMAALPNPWDANNDEYESELMLRRQLALYSIVDTITEMGKFGRVMIQINRGSGVAEKLRRSEAGITSMGDRAIDLISRDASWVLTARRSAELALDAFVDKDWSRFSGFIAGDVDGTSAPNASELRDLLQQRPSLISYTIAPNETVMPGGDVARKGVEQATLTLDVTFSDAVGVVTVIESVPLRMVREDGIWQIAYPSLSAMVPTP